MFHFILTLWVNPVPYLSILEAPPIGAFPGAFIVANHKRTVVLYCYMSHACQTKVFQQDA